MLRKLPKISADIVKHSRLGRVTVKKDVNS